MSEPNKGVRVTVEDLNTGQSESVIVKDNWVITTQGTCDVTSRQEYPKSGTTVLTIKKRAHTDG